MTSELPPLRDVIARHGLAAKKSLGQHFLLDTNLLARIVRSAGDLAGRHVIEVGPGPGGLTRAILASSAAHVTAVEKDSRCIAALAQLKEVYGDRFSLHEADAMKLDLTAMEPSPRVMISNLPYNVGTALIIDWLQQAALHGTQALEGFTVMVQKEVAERLTAKVGDEAYGRLSVLVHQFADAEMLFDVPPAAFVPPPKVTSTIVRARILAKPRVEIELKRLESVVAAAFNQRRKMLRGSLKSISDDPVELCARAGIDPTLRAENCSLEMFAALARSL